MASSLRIITYNCKFVRNSEQVIDTLLSSCDILCLQETLIDDAHQSALYINSNFHVSYVPSVRSIHAFTGRSSGGLVIYWRKSIRLEASPVKFTNRLIGLKVCAKRAVYLFENVYSFFDYGNFESLLSYEAHLAELADICNNENFHEIIIIGHLNADHVKGEVFQRIV